MEIFGDIQIHLTNAANNMPHFTGLDVTAILNSIYAFAGIIAVGFIGATVFLPIVIWKACSEPV